MDMQSIGRLVVQFFTRPIKLSDFTVTRLVRRRSAGTPAIKESVADFAPTQIADRAEIVDVWGRSLGADVSEEPIHTLPAELQEELGLRNDDRKPDSPERSET